MIRDEDGALTGYIYIDLKDTNYGGFVRDASTIHVLILVPIFFIAIKERALRRGRLVPENQIAESDVVVHKNV